MIQSVKWFYRAWRYRLKLDRAEIAWLLFSLRAGQTAVDIGAHKGAYTWWMAKRVAQTGRVFAFEPQPGLAKRLSGLVRTHRRRQVTVESMGLSFEPAEMELMVPAQGNSPGASFEETRDALGGDSLAVPVSSLDDYFMKPDIGPVHLIKCDTEGHELQVFRGGESLLQKYHPDLMFECEARHRGPGGTAEVFSYLEHLGYVGYFFDAEKLKPIGEFKEAVHQARPGSKHYVNNFLFSKPGVRNHAD